MSDAKKASLKPMWRTASAFPTPEVLKLLQPHHDVVASLLVSCLSPIATHRASLSTTAKKRSHKRNRKRKAKQTESQARARNVQPRDENIAPPEIKKHILVGFNSVTRHLERLSVLSRMTPVEKTKASHDLIAAVFLFRPMDDLLYSHLPLLCHTASLSYPESPPIRLVLLDPSSGKRIAAAMALSQDVSLMAVHDSASDGAGAKALIDYVRQNIDAMQLPWLKPLVEGQWLGNQVEVQ